MSNSQLSTVIEVLKNHQRKLLYIDDIKQLFAPSLGKLYTDKKCYKLIYHLKNKGHLVSLKKDIFYVSTPQEVFSEQDLLERHYRPILHKHCHTSFGKYRYIGGIKALELHYQNIDIPDQILVINGSKQASDTVVTGKLLHAKTYTQKKNNLFVDFAKYTQKVRIGKYSFPIAQKELAILECLFSYDETADRYAYEYIKKLLKKYELDLQIVEKILMVGKHHTSINRLLDLLKPLKPKIADHITKLIKKHSFILSL